MLRCPPSGGGMSHESAWLGPIVHEKQPPGARAMPRLPWYSATGAGDMGAAASAQAPVRAARADCRPSRRPAPNRRARTCGRRRARAAAGARPQARTSLTPKAYPPPEAPRSRTPGPAARLRWDGRCACAVGSAWKSGSRPSRSIGARWHPSAKRLVTFASSPPPPAVSSPTRIDTGPLGAKTGGLARSGSSPKVPVEGADGPGRPARFTGRRASRPCRQSARDARSRCGARAAGTGSRDRAARAARHRAR